MARLANIVWELPEALSVQGTTAMLERAVDAALLQHRSDVLPRHFTREAIQRYPEAYKYACPGPSPRNKIGAALKLERGALSAWLKAAGPEVRRNYFAQWRQEQRERLADATRATRGRVASGTRERSRDRRNEIPLFDTGAMKALALGGGGRITGPATSRTMHLDIPLPYVHVQRKNWKGGALNKSKALQATANDEIEAFAARMDAVLQAQFNAIP
jgi:hypothetical protein